jgi:hypothetical protein
VENTPVSIALILPGSLNASLRIKNSWSSFVKMSLVTTAAKETHEQHWRQEEGKKRTDVVCVAEVSAKSEGKGGLAGSDGSVERRYISKEQTKKIKACAYPPIPMVKPRSVHLRPE